MSYKLPDSYYENLAKSLEVSNTTGQSVDSSLYDNLFVDQLEEELTPSAGTAWDFFGNVAWGAASGITWGVSEYGQESAGYSQPWEQMSGAAKTGWILGEGLSLMTPYVGPFAAMGKGARLLTKAAKANKYVDNAAKNTLKGFNKLSSNQAKGIINDASAEAQKLGITAQEVIEKKYGQNVTDLLTKAGHSDDSVGWLSSITHAADNALDAKANLQMSGANVIKKAFKDVGDEIADDDAITLAAKWVQDLTENKTYVNDVAEWVERGLRGSGVPFASRENVSKYLGMAVQDMVFMSAHGTISGAVKANVHGEEYDVATGLVHSGKLALAFPILRAFGGGGHDKLATGIKAYFSKWQKSNHSQILAEHGEGTLRNIGRIYATGSKTNLYSGSELANTTWKWTSKKGRDIRLGGKDDILEFLGFSKAGKKAAGYGSTDEVLELMGMMKGVSRKQFLSKWGPKYLDDLVRSVPRMGGGIALMNPWVVDANMWANMDTGEIASHMFMAAIMTKGKGAWGRRDQAQYFADFSKERDLMNKLGVKSKDAMEFVSFHDGQNFFANAGASMANTELGQSVKTIIDEALSHPKATISASHKKTPEDMQKVTTLANVYDIMRAYTDGPITRNTIEKLISLDGVTFDNMMSKLNNLTIRKEGGRDMLFKDVDSESVLLELTRVPTENSIGIYKDFFKQLGEMGFNFKISAEGQIIGSGIDAEINGDSLGSIGKINDVITSLVKAGGIVSEQGFTATEGNITIKQAAKNAGISVDEMQVRVEALIGNTMNKISREYGGNVSFKDFADNPVLDMIGRSKNIEAANTIWSIISPTDAQMRDPNMSHITGIGKSMDKLFETPDVVNGKGRYAKDIFEYLQNIEGYNPNAKDGTPEFKAHKEIMDMLTVLQPLFNIKRAVNGGISNTGPTKTLDIDTLREVYNGFKSEFDKLAPQWRSADMQTTFESIFVDRLFRQQGMSPHVIPITRYLMDNNLALFEKGELYIPKESALREFLKRKSVSEDQQNEILESYTLLEKTIGDNIVKRANFVIFDNMSDANFTGYIKAAKMLGTQQIRDVLFNVKDVLDKIDTIPTGFRSELTEMQTSLKLLIKQTDPTRSQAKTIDDLIVLSKKVDALESKLLIDSKLSNRTGDVAKGPLSDIKVQIEQLIKEYKVGVEDVINAGKPVDEALTLEKLQAMESSIQKNLTNLILGEHTTIDMANNALINLQSFILNGRKGNGLSAADAQKSIEFLVRQYTEAYKSDLLKNVNTISELFEKINEGGMSFADGAKLIEAFQLHVSTNILVNNKNHWAHEIGVNAQKSLEKGNNVHDKQQTVHEILTDYNLVERDGSVKKGFIDAVSVDYATGNKIGKALKEFVKKEIYAGSGTTGEKRAKWIEFKDTKAMPVLLQLRNQKPINRIRITGAGLGGSNNAVAVGSHQVLSASHPNTSYFEKKGLKVWFMDDSVDIDIGGKLRNTSLDMLHGSADKVQNYLTNALLNSSTKDQILKTLAASGQIDPALVHKLLTEVDVSKGEHNLIYARLSPANKVLFVGTQENLITLNKDYAEWYDATHKRYDGTDHQITFEKIFSKLKDSGSKSRSTIELKLLAPYLSRQGSKDAFDRLMQAYHKGSEKDYSKIQADLFKRGYLVDGGTTTTLNVDVLKFMSSKGGHSDPEMRAIYRKLWKDQNGKLNTQIIDETTVKDDINHPLNIRGIVSNNLQQSAGTSTLLGRIAQNNLREILDPNYKGSLNNSLLDGAKYASESLMKVLMSAKGVWKTNWEDSPNGAKTIIFAVGDNQLLGKGFIIYNPSVAKNMPKDVDIMLGTESAKNFSGTNLKGTDIQPYKINKQLKNKDDWSTGLKASGNESRMLIDFSDVGISFTSKNTKGVTISPSVFDFMGKDVIKSASDWMGIDTKLKKMEAEWSVIHQDGGQLANFLFDINEMHSVPTDRGHNQLAKNLILYGAKPGNFLVSEPLRRILRDKNYEQLRTQTNKEGGEDNFIAPNATKDLSTPIIAKIYGPEVNGQRVEMYRSKMQLGGMAINNNTATQRRSQSNIEQDIFIYRDKRGVDISISLQNGKFRVASNFYSKYSQSPKGSGIQTDVNKYEPFGNKSGRFKIEPSVQKNIEKVLNNVNDLAIKHGLSFKDIFLLLKGNTITRSGKRLKLDDLNIKRAKDFKIEQGGQANAIPVIGHDKVAFRIQSIRDKMDGLVEVNVDDLRRIMQRDHDGDHLYTHTKMPWELWTNFLRENGMKSDFNMMNTDNVLTKEYINIFGISKESLRAGKVGQAGEDLTDTGFHTYANKLAVAKMNMGTLIGLRSSLSWLAKTGVKFGKNKLLKNVIDVERIDKDTWKVLNAYYDVIQNTVDIHGGIHELVANKSGLENLIFYGEVPPILADKIKKMKAGELADRDPALEKILQISKEGGMINIADFKNSAFQKLMFTEIIQTLKKANQIQNDTWDEAGSRNVEPHELKRAFYNIKNLFDTPNTYLSSRMRSRLLKMKDNGQDVSELTREYIETFYGPNYLEYSKSGIRDDLYQQILKGGKGLTLVENKWGFDSADLPYVKDEFNNMQRAGTENTPGAFDYTIQGKILSGLVRRNIFWESNYGGIGIHKSWDQSKIADVLGDAGVFVREMEGLMEMSRLLGEKNIVNKFNEETINVDIRSFGIRSGSDKTVRNAVNNGILRELIQKQFDNLTTTLEYYRQEPHINPNKIERVAQRLGNLAKAKQVMDRLVLKDMVIGKDQVQIIHGNKISAEKGRIERFNNLYDGQNYAIYSYKGDVKIKAPNVDKDGNEIARPQKRLFDFETADTELHYSHLKFEGYFSNKSKPFKMRSGTTYIVDKKPVQREAVDNLTNQYNKALAEMTYTKEYRPEVFMESQESADRMREAAVKLRAEFSLDHSATIKSSLANRVLRNPLYAMEYLRDTANIREFYEKFHEELAPNAEPIMLLKYLMQPQASATKYTVDPFGNYVPSYKSNKHLIKRIFQFIEEYQGETFKAEGFGDFLMGDKSFMKEWENRVSRPGVDANIDIGPYERSIQERFDYGQLGAAELPIKSLLRFRGLFFDTPFFDLLLKPNLTSTETLKIIETRNPVSGDNMNINIVGKTSIWDLVRNSSGNGSKIC